MHDFIPEQAGRSDAWQQAHAVSAGHSDRGFAPVRHDADGGRAHDACNRNLAIRHLHSSEVLTSAPFALMAVQKEDLMSAPRWRSSLIGVWLALTCLTFMVNDSMALRSWLLLLVFGFVPPVVLIWLWNEDRPQLIGSLRRRQNQL